MSRSEAAHRMPPGKQRVVMEINHKLGEEPF